MREDKVCQARPDPLILALEAWLLVSVRTRNCLGHLYHPNDPASTLPGIPIEEMRLSHLSRFPGYYLFRIPNMGQLSYCEIATMMDRYGWNFDGYSIDGSGAPPLAGFGQSLPRYMAKVVKSAEKRRAQFERGLLMKQLYEQDHLSVAAIGERFGVGGAAVSAAIIKTRELLASRERLPLPSPPLHA